MADDAILKHAGGELTLSGETATDGENAYNISPLLKTTGHVTLDPGFVNTASCDTSPAPRGSHLAAAVAPGLCDVTGDEDGPDG